MAVTKIARTRAMVLLSFVAAFTLACRGTTSSSNVSPEHPTRFAQQASETPEHKTAASAVPLDAKPPLSGDPASPNVASSTATTFPLDVPFGTNTTVAVGPIAPHGEWVVLCPAGGGATAAATLHAASGPSTNIDGWLGSSADGRFVAFAKQERWLLVDTHDWRTTDLGERGIDRGLARSATPIRTLHFHPTQPRLAFVAQTPEGARVVIVDLETLAERSFAAPSGAVDRLRWDPSGKALLLEDDPNPPKASAQRRSPPSGTLPAPCAAREPLLLVDTSRLRPRRTTVLRASDGQGSLGPGHLLALDGGSFGWTTDRDLVLRRGAKESRLLPPACQSTVLGVHPATETVLAGCAEHGRLRLFIVSVTRQVALDVEIPQVYDLFDRVISNRFLPLYSGNKTHLLDFDQGKALPLQDRDQLLAQNGSEILLRRGALVIRRNVETTHEETLGSGVPSGARVILAPGHAYVAPRLYSARVDAGAPFPVPTSPLAIDSRGCALVPASIEPDGRFHGPVRWICR